MKNLKKSCVTLAGVGCPVTISLVLSVLSEEVCVAFSFETSICYGRWHVKWNVSDQRVGLNCNGGMVSLICFV